MRHLIVGFLIGAGLAGCTPKEMPLPPVPPPAEDLSHWTVPTLIQPENQQTQAAKSPPRKATAAETVYDYVPGGVYKITVALDAPLDIILERGEKVQALIGSDPKPIQQTPQAPAPEGNDAKPQVKERWEYKPALHGLGEDATPHIMLRALEAGATLGLTVTTSRRVLYLTCASVVKSPIRAVWWRYPPDPSETRAQTEKLPRPLPDLSQPTRWHVGYRIETQGRPPDWMVRGVWDEGHKMYLLLPMTTLYGTTPLVRAIGPSGPTLLNTRQYKNVVIVDLLAPRLELRVGTGETAEIITITRGNLTTIECPSDPQCPSWEKE